MVTNITSNPASQAVILFDSGVGNVSTSHDNHYAPCHYSKFQHHHSFRKEVNKTTATSCSRTIHSIQNRTPNIMIQAWQQRVDCCKLLLLEIEDCRPLDQELPSHSRILLLVMHHPPHPRRISQRGHSRSVTYDWLWNGT